MEIKPLKTIIRNNLNKKEIDSALRKEFFYLPVPYFSRTAVLNIIANRVLGKIRELDDHNQQKHKNPFKKMGFAASSFRI